MFTFYSSDVVSTPLKSSHLRNILAFLAVSMGNKVS